MQWLVFEKNAIGHRGEYADVFSKVLNAKQITGFSFANTVRLLKFPAVIFSSCDDYLIRFFLISLLRRWLGRPSVAIATRAEAVYKPSTVRIKLKRLIYELLKKNSHIKVVSILPFYVEPRLKEIADDWIYDPQFWDIPYCNSGRHRNICPDEFTEHPKLSDSKAKVVLPGNISKRKGAEFMMELFLTNDLVRQNFSFILGGSILDVNHEIINDFENAGGIVLGRPPTFDELIGLYDLADIIWCCYPKRFNHSSGIFARSLQLGVPVVIRKSSYLSRFDIPYTMKCMLDYGDIQGSAIALNKFKDQMSRNVIKLCSADKIRLICGRIT